MADAAKKISLNTISFDGHQVEHVKPVLYDLEYLRHMNLKKWESGGKLFNDRCAIFNPAMNGQFILLKLTSEELQEKLTSLGIWEVVK